MEDTQNPVPEEYAPQPDPASRGGASRMIREAREKAGIAASKLCADLRISPSTLEALEAGEYGKLAGAPYVRAMLVSLSRHLKLNTKDVLQAYAEETGGAEAQTVQVSPYKDDSGTHAKAHKQIFILLLAVLLFILLLIMGKVNTSSSETETLEPEAPPAVADTLLNIDPLSDDSLGLNDTVPADSLSALGTAAPPGPGAQESTDEEEEEEIRETRVRILGLSDSVWLRVLPAGEREVSQYLRTDRALTFSHSDAITFITRQSRSVRVFLGDSSIVPTRRRFKVDADQITY